MSENEHTEALKSLLPDPDRQSPNVVERVFTMGRAFLKVGGAYVAMEGTQCYDPEYGERCTDGVIRWTSKDFKRIEEKFAKPIREALATSK